MLMTNDGDQEKLFSETLEAESFQLAMQYLNDLVSRITLDGIFLYATSSCASLLGYSQQELCKTSLYTYCHPSEIDSIKHAFDDLDLYKQKRITFRFLHKEGHYIWLETNLALINDEKEIISISRDITEKVNAREEIIENQEKYRFLVEYSKDTIGVVTPKGVWTYINNEGKKVFGLTNNKEIIGTSLYEYTFPSDHSLLEDFLQKRQSANFELNIIRPDEQIKKTEVQLIPTTLKNRNVFQIIIKDLTNQKKTEEQLQNAEKLSVVGQLAAGIAHEIRNPLTSIKGFTQLLNEEKSSQFGDVILTELERIEDIVNDLLVLAKPKCKERAETNLVRVVNSVVTLLNSQALMQNIFIDVQANSSDVMIWCEEDKIKQVLINVVKNAIESMHAGGDIVVAIFQEINYAAISIKDQGIGIPEDLIKKIGEPFFSTKEKGTGLGLMICKNIIKNHGGHLHINSKENGGTTIKILLPLAKDQ